MNQLMIGTNMGMPVQDEEYTNKLAGMVDITPTIITETYLNRHKYSHQVALSVVLI